MFESVGLLRTIGGIVVGVGGIVKAIGYTEVGTLLLEIGAAISGTGVVRAAAAGTLWNMNKSNSDEK
jgi:hypothetical protein